MPDVPDLISVGDPDNAYAYAVLHRFGDKRALILYGGLAVLVDEQPNGRWELSGVPATPGEQIVIERVMPARDTTDVAIVKDE
jgi:hypothetical protein